MNRCLTVTECWRHIVKEADYYSKLNYRNEHVLELLNTYKGSIETR